MKVLLCAILMLVGCATTNSDDEEAKRQAEIKKQIGEELSMLAQFMCQVSGGVKSVSMPTPKEDDPNTYTAHVVCVNGVSGNAWVTVKDKDDGDDQQTIHPNPKF